MSTRSITHIHQMKSLDSNEEVICSFYRHCDGYIAGHCADLVEFLTGKSLKNGIGSDFVEGSDFNRAGAMAIQLCAFIQNETSCEIVPTNSSYPWIDYVYHIYFDKEFKIKVTCGTKETSFNVSDFDAIEIESHLSDDD